MPYSYVTLAQVRAQLAAKLYDTSVNLFWSDAEKNQYIFEALRTWNSLTSTWRAEFIFQTSVNITWYDLTSQPNTHRPYTLTDNYLMQMIEYHLLEPLTSIYPLVWAGSAQFSATDILYAIQRKRDEVLSITGCTISQNLVSAVPGRTFLPDSVIDVRRVAWIPISTPAGYTATPLIPEDQWSQQSFEADYTVQAPGTPSSYRQSTEPPLSFDTDIPPAVPGQYDMLTVKGGVLLSATASALLRVPDDFAWVIKWGALSDLLNRESNAKDPYRAAYCDMRYKQGLSALLNSPAVLYARVNNIPLDIDSVQNVDNFRVGWQAETTGLPDTLMTAGLNMVATAPIANGSYGITAMVVQNAPLPVQDTDNVQASKGDLESIVGYAQHLAAFKMGGQEFMSTLPLLDEFHDMAMIRNSKLKELGEFTQPIYEQSRLQKETNPVYQEIDPISG